MNRKRLSPMPLVGRKTKITKRSDDAEFELQQVKTEDCVDERSSTDSDLVNEYTELEPEDVLELSATGKGISGLGSIKEYVKLEPEDPIESSATGKGLRTNSEDGNTKSSEASGSSSYDNKADRSLSVDDVLQCIGSAFLNNKVPSNLAKDIISKLQRGLEFDSDKLIPCIEDGDIKKIGETIRQGIRSNSLNDLQLAEISSRVSRPNISFTSFVAEVEKASVDDLKSILVGQQFWNTLQTSETVHANLYDALESGRPSAKQKVPTDFGLQMNKKLEISHEIHAEGLFPSKNLSEFFYRTNLFGTRIIDQMCDLYKKLFKELLTPTHRIWQFTYRPTNHRAGDCHFTPIPKNVVRALFDFGMDAIQSYLPPHLIPQEASLDDLFVHSLPYQDPVEVVWRRRENYKQAGDLVKDALSLSLRALRSYHWEMDKDVLRPCSDCKDSSNHLKWEQVKTHRAKCRKIGTDPDDWTPKYLMQQ